MMTARLNEVLSPETIPTSSGFHDILESLIIVAFDNYLLT
jgi:hypothetical protein